MSVRALASKRCPQACGFHVSMFTPVCVHTGVRSGRCPAQNHRFGGGVRRCLCRVRCHLGLWPGRRGRVRRCPSPCPLNLREALYKTFALGALSVGVRAVSVAIWASGLGAAAVSVGVRRCPSPCPLNLREAIYETFAFRAVSVGVRAFGLGAAAMSVGVRHRVC